MTAPELPTGRALDDLVVREAFGRATGDEVRALHHPANVEAWRLTLEQIAQSLDAQLDVRRNDSDWRKRTLHLRARLTTRIREARVLARNAHLRDCEAAGRLRQAIEHHRDVTRGDDALPVTTADVVLWAVLDEVPAR